MLTLKVRVYILIFFFLDYACNKFNLEGWKCRSTNHRRVHLFLFKLPQTFAWTREGFSTSEISLADVFVYLRNCSSGKTQLYQNPRLVFNYSAINGYLKTKGKVNCL